MRAGGAVRRARVRDPQRPRRLGKHAPLRAAIAPERMIRCRLL
jgi:hypothetical protein